MGQLAEPCLPSKRPPLLRLLLQKIPRNARDSGSDNRRLFAIREWRTNRVVRTARWLALGRDKKRPQQNHGGALPAPGHGRATSTAQKN